MPQRNRPGSISARGLRRPLQRAGALALIILLGAAGPLHAASAALEHVSLIGGSVTQVHVHAGRLYATEGAGMRVFDLTHADAPAPIGQAATPFVGGELSVHGNRAVISDSADTEYYILDIADPEDPWLAHRSSPANRGDVLTTGGLAYALFADALVTLGLDTPTTPARLHELPMSQPVQMALEGRRLALTERYGDRLSLTLLDLADLEAPGVLYRYPIVYVEPRDLMLRDGVIWLLSSNAIRAVDMNDPSSPTTRLRMNWDEELQGFGLHEDLLLVGAGQPPRLELFTISSLDTPTTRGTLALTDAALDFAAFGDRVYTALGRGGLETLDLSDPDNPSVVGHRETFFANGVSYADGRLAVADGGRSNLNIVTVEDPAAPALLGSFPQGGTLVRCRTYAEWVYCAGLEVPTFFSIVDARNPADLRIVGNTPLPLPILDFDVSLFRAFILDNLRLHIIRMDSYLTPTLATSHTPTLPPRAVAAADDRWAYLLAGNPADGRGRLIVYDCLDPAHPQAVTTRTLGIGARGLAFQAQRIYALGSQTLEVFDVADRPNPLLTDSIPVVGQDHVVVDWPFAWMIDDPVWDFTRTFLTDLVVADVAQPTRLADLGELGFNTFFRGGLSSAGSLAAHGPVIYLARGSLGLSIMRYTGPRPVNAAHAPWDGYR